MQIKGFHKTSLIDYPGKICSIIFLPDCNFRCGFCHNKDLVVNSPNLPELSQEKILAYLKNKQRWIDGVCITGGEPTLHSGLKDLCKKIKHLGLLVKLDTNGTNPELLKELIQNNLVDYIAMDIKSSPKKYSLTAGVPVDLEKIEQSIEIIQSVDHEFRMTVVPTLHSEKDMEAIAKWLSGVKLFKLQQFRPDNTLDELFQGIVPYDPSILESFKEILGQTIETVELVGI